MPSGPTKYGSLELRVMSGRDFSRPLLDFDVRRNALALNNPAVFCPNPQVGCGDHAAVHKDRESQDADQASPGAFPDELAQPGLPEQPRQQIAAVEPLIGDDRLPVGLRVEAVSEIYVAAIMDHPQNTERTVS